MHKLRFQLLKGLLAPVLALGLAAGCQTYNPATGQQEIDYGATAGVAGAAMGAAALGVALSNNNDDRYYGGGYRGPVYYGGGVRRGHNDVNVNRNVNVSGNTVNRYSNNSASRNINRSANRTVNRGNNFGGGGGRLHR
jgi:hypothetical protein